MKKHLIFLFLLSILLLSACNVKNNGQDIPNNQVNHVDGYNGEVIAGSTTPYIRYSKEDFDKARSENKIIYLYFYATWCPICKSERPSIFAAFDEMNYDNVVGFEVHFNDDKTNQEDEDIARELGIAYQHTSIIFDKNGNEEYRSLSKISKDELKEEIIKLI